MFDKLSESHLRLRKSLQARFIGDVQHITIAIFDDNGEMAASSSFDQIANATAVVQSLVEIFPDLAVGEAAITNDPYSGSAHLQDHWLYTPVERDGSVDGAVVVSAHLADVGGEYFGNYSPYAGDLWREGTRTTPIRVRRRGEVDRDVIETIKLNSRMPEAMEADIALMLEVALDVAQTAADLSVEACRELITTSERQVVSFLRPVGDRSETGTAEIHNCAGAHPNVTLRVHLSGEALAVDFAGTAPDTPKGFVNSTLATTTSAVARILARAVGCNANAGVLRALDISAPESSLVNCRYPYAVGWSPYEPSSTIDMLVWDTFRSWGLDCAVLSDPAHGTTARPAVRVEGCRETGCPYN